LSWRDSTVDAITYPEGVTATPRRVVPGPVFRWFALASFISMIVIVLSGAAVRLTGSGLGCPDWPTCFKGRISGSWSIHPLIEYTNRVVTVTLIFVTVATLLAAILREVRRRDLIILSGMLIGGVVADAILGAFVVYSKLNPWLVSLHMLLSLSMVVISAVLYHRSKYVYGPGARRDVRDRHFLLIARLLWIPFVVLLITGTMTTGSGPHAGSSQGQLVARRLPFAFSSAACPFARRGSLHRSHHGSAVRHLDQGCTERASIGGASPRHHLTGAGRHRRDAVPHARAAALGRTARRGRGVAHDRRHPVPLETECSRPRAGYPTPGTWS